LRTSLNFFFFFKPIREAEESTIREKNREYWVKVDMEKKRRKAEKADKAKNEAARKKERAEKKAVEMEYRFTRLNDQSAYLPKDWSKKKRRRVSRHGGGAAWRKKIKWFETTPTSARSTIPVYTGAANPSTSSLSDQLVKVQLGSLN
jgi:hypothetical protein